MNDGADEIDMVINRGAFLAGEFGEDAGFLGEVAHAAEGAAVHGEAGDVLSGEEDFGVAAGVGVDHADGHAEAGGLAGAVAAEETDDFCAFDGEGDIIDDEAVGEGLAEFVGL